MNPILLINPNTSRETTDMMLRVLRACLPDNFDVIGETATIGASMITSDEALATSVREVARIGHLRASGVSAVIVGAFGDPGVAELRSELSIPVIGIGESALREAAQGGRRFGVATTTPGLDGSITRAVANFGLDGLCIGTRIPSGDPLALAAKPREQVEALAKAVQACIDDGARAVVIGGGPLSDAAEALDLQFGIPIISAVAAAGRLARRLLTNAENDQ